MLQMLIKPLLGVASDAIGGYMETKKATSARPTYHGKLWLIYDQNKPSYRKVSEKLKTPQSPVKQKQD